MWRLPQQHGGSSPIKMRRITLLASILVAASFVPLLQAEEIIKDKSPDGKFALRMTHGEEGWEVAIVDLRTKKSVVDLDVYGNFVEDMRLLWSKDSKRVAHFEPDRRGGTTHIYFRNGSKFEEVQFPSGEVPECHGNLTAEEVKKFLKTTEATESPKAWLKSGALVIAVDESWITEDGGGHSCSQTVTIAFDANRKAFVQSVTDKKVD
jgi:hypothetical protein